MQLRPTLWTIGHSNQIAERLLARLTDQRIEVLADVRSYPYSSYCHHFDQDAIRATVEAAGIRYVFLGGPLGGRPDGSQYYDTDGHVLYSRVAEEPWFLQAIADLERMCCRSRVALMCSEEDPAVCHRHLLIARVLDQRDVSVRHIRADGSVQDYAAVEQARVQEDDGQLMLFEPQEPEPWKSLRSVSPKKRQPSSLGH